MNTASWLNSTIYSIWGLKELSSALVTAGSWASVSLSGSDGVPVSNKL